MNEEERKPALSDEDEREVVGGMRAVVVIVASVGLFLICLAVIIAAVLLHGLPA